MSIISCMKAVNKRERFVKSMAVAIAAAGLMVGVGWILNIEVIKSVVPHFPSMKFNSALCFLTTGICLYLIQADSKKSIVLLLSSSTFVFTLVTFLQSTFSVDLGIDQFFILDREASQYPGRMAQTTSLSFVLLSTGFFGILSNKRITITIAQFAFHAVGFIAFIAILGYFFNIEMMHKLSSYNSMALHTSFLFLALSIAASLLQPTYGITNIFYGERTGNRLARKAFVALLLSVIFLSALRLLSHRYNLVSVEFGIAMFATSFIFVGLLMIGIAAKWLNNVDRGLQSASRELSNFKRAIAQSSIVSRTDKNGTILEVNDNFLEISGHKREDLVGRNHRSSNSGYHSRQFWADMWNTVNSGKTWRGDVRNKAKDGSYYWVDTFIIPFLDEKGNVHEFFSIRNDITQRKAQEEKIIKINQSLTDFQDAIQFSSIVSRADRSGVITYVNENFVKISGYTAKELIGQTHRIINSRYHSQQFWIDMWKTIASGKTWRAEVKNKAKDGSFYWVDTFVMPFVDQQGNVHEFLSIRNDITQRKEQEANIVMLNESLKSINFQLEEKVDVRTRELLQANKHLEAVTEQLNKYNDKLKNYIHIISHNLRSYVVNLNYFVKYLLEEKNEEERTGLLMKMKSVVSNFNQTIEALVEVVKIEGEKDVPVERIDIDLLLRETLKVLGGEIQKTHAQIDWDFSEAPSIASSKVYMESIFLNMISNSIKYKAPDRKPLIKVKSVKTKNSVSLSFEDNGLGIDLERNQNKLFGLNKTFHRHPEARGVGLFLTKTQVESMGGKITASSKVDQGTIFTIELPQ